MNKSIANIFVLAMCWMANAQVAAHPVSLTRALAYVTQDAMTVKMEVFVEDLYLFHKLEPNEQDFLEPDVIRTGIEQHKRFLLERFVVRDVAGEQLVGRVVGLKEFEMDERGVALAALMAHTIEFEFEYELPKPPEFLTFSQRFTGEEIFLPSELSLVVKQENAGTAHETVLRPNEPDTVRFSWENPPLSPEASQADQQAWLARQKQETLGITSYSSVYSFLYIDDFEIRHEILIPLLTLEDSILIARDEDEFLDLVEQDAARQQIEAYFTSGNPIEIDGALVTPTVQRCDFYGLDFKDFAKQSERRRVSMANARVGIILSYPTKKSPNNLRLTWNRFNNFVWTINMMVYAYGETTQVALSRLGNNNIFSWQNSRRQPIAPLAEVAVKLSPPPRVSVPVLTITCLALIPAAVLALKRCGAASMRYLAAAALLAICAVVCWPYSRVELANPFAPAEQISDEQASRIFTTLHTNTYRAFEFRDEEKVYDALAKCVDGELLSDMYVQIRRGLEMQEQGGAVSRVRDVAIIEGRRESLAAENRQAITGFRFRCRWNVDGTVEHWGHVHSRVNQYDAEFVIEPRENYWKITDVELLDESRVKFETAVRGL